MSLFDIYNREELKSPVLDTFEFLTSALGKWATKEHNDDGTHATITTPKITSTAGMFEKSRTVAAGYFSDVLPNFDAKQFTSALGSWTVASTDILQLRYARIGNLVIYIFHIGTGTVVSAATTAAIYLPLPPGMIIRPVDPVLDVFTENWCRVIDNAVSVQGRCLVETPYNRIQVSRFDAANFTGTSLGMRGQICFEANPD